MYSKMCLTNGIIELWEYTKVNTNPILNLCETEYGKSVNSDLHYLQTQSRRRDVVRRLIRLNFTSKAKFVTLTFKDEIKDVVKANKLFNLFIKRLAYNLKSNPKYIAVIEFQDKKQRGVVHYHLLIDMPYISKERLAKIWSYGFIFINKIRHVDDLGAYVSKYMSKERNDLRLKGLKGYNCSHDLERPTYLKSWKGDSKTIMQLVEMYGLTEKNATYHRSGQTEEGGEYHYFQFNLNRINGKKQDENNLNGHNNEAQWRSNSRLSCN
jgi:hypothetical protein